MYVRSKRIVVGTEMTRVIMTIHAETTMDVDTSKYVGQTAIEAALMGAEKALEKVLLDDAKKSFNLVDAPGTKAPETVPKKEETTSAPKKEPEKIVSTPAEKITPIPTSVPEGTQPPVKEVKKTESDSSP